MCNWWKQNWRGPSILSASRRATKLLRSIQREKVELGNWQKRLRTPLSMRKASSTGESPGLNEHQLPEVLKDIVDGEVKRRTGFSHAHISVRMLLSCVIQIKHIGQGLPRWLRGNMAISLPSNHLRQEAIRKLVGRVPIVQEFSFPPPYSGPSGGWLQWSCGHPC